MTQFGRSLAELNIEIICANSSQAKGRVERANRTLQDRLVKALRLEGIATIAAANTFRALRNGSMRGLLSPLPDQTICTGRATSRCRGFATFFVGAGCVMSASNCNYLGSAGC
jgi:hypothetical protein